MKPTLPQTPRRTLIECATAGFYFCKRCQRVTERIDIEGTGWGGCTHCHSPLITYHHPTLQRHETTPIK